MTDKKNRTGEPADSGEPRFKIVDRRRIDAEDVEASDSPPEREAPSRPPPPKPEEETTTGANGDIKAEEDIPEEIQDDAGDEAPPEDLDPLDYRNLSLSFLQTLSTTIWVHLGLVPHPQTQLVAKKMEDARKVISLMEILYREGKDDWPAEINTQIERILQDVKANYVNQL